MKNTWLEDVKQTLSSFDGEASLLQIYDKVKTIRTPLSKYYKAAIRNTLEKNSRGRGYNIFEPKEIGSGIWKLKEID